MISGGSTVADMHDAASGPSLAVPGSAAGETAPALPARAVRLALAVVCLAVFLTALDQTVVVTALENMINDIGVPVTALDRAAWIVSGYLLGYVIAMPLMGRVADVFGRRRIFVICLVIFGVGSALCGLAPVLGAPVSPDTSIFGGMLLAPVYSAVQWLLGLSALIGVDQTYPALNVMVAARFIQALGGGALVPVALAVTGDLFGGTRRGLALGLIGAVTEAGGVLGPLWGAWLTATIGWQWIFWINLPVAALLLVGGVTLLPRSARRHGERIDLVGALLLGASVACLTIGLGAQAGAVGAVGLTTPASVNPTLVIVALVLLAVFILFETRLRWPVVDMALFRRGAFSAASALSLLIGAALIVAMVLIPVFVITVLNEPPIQSGLALLCMTGWIPVGALAGGWFSVRAGCRATAALGCACTAVGFWLMHLWPVDVGWVQIFSAAAIAGLGFGLVIAPITTSALNSVTARQSGSASAVVTVLRMTGMVLGLGLLVSWALSRFNLLVKAHPVPLPQPGQSAADAAAALQAYYNQVVVPAAHQVYTDTFLVIAGICVLAILPAILLWRVPRAGEASAEERPAYSSYVAPMA
jgi:MFS family permease